MLRSYFIVALRTFSRQKVYTFINISGLAIGLAGALLIFGYIIDELNYDMVHPYAKNTYRIGTHGIFEDGNEQTFAETPRPEKNDVAFPQRLQAFQVGGSIHKKVVILLLLRYFWCF